MRIRPFVLALGHFLGAFLAAQAASPGPDASVDRWRVQRNPLTGTPSLIDGYAVPLAGPLTRETIEARTREFLAKLARVLQVDVRDLVLTSAQFQAPKNPGTVGTWYVAYRQVYRGLPVIGGSVRLVVSEGRVVSTRADAYPGIDRPIEPKIPLESALSAIAPPGVAPVSSRLVIAPRTEGGRIVYHLAWEILLPVEKAPYATAVKNPRADPKDARLRDVVPVQWRYLVDAETRAILERHNVVHYGDVQGTVTGPVRASVPTDPPSTRPIAKMEVRIRDATGIAFPVETDSGGAYNVTGLAAGSASLTGRLGNSHFSVVNSEAPPGSSHSATVTVPSTYNWDWAVSDLSRSQVETNAFYHVNVVRDWFLRATPFDVDGAPATLTVQVRAGPFCQAGSFPTLLFFGSGRPGVCEDLALCSDIVYHEYTHNVVNAVYAASGLRLEAMEDGPSMHEGFADFFSLSITSDPSQGEGCGLARNIDTPDKRYPDDLTGEPHDDSMIFSGALWDLRAFLPAEYVDSLAMRAMKRTPGSYSDYLAAVLQEDDNPAYSTGASANDDPADGTPNIDGICHSYFDLHGIYHPYCAGHTTGLVALLTAPPSRSFTLLPATATTLTVEGTAEAGSASPFARFTLEYAVETAPTTWLTTGVTLAGGGASPVAGGALGTIALAGLADGMYRVRLTVTDAAGTTAGAKGTFYIDRSIKPGWPQATGVHFYGTPAAANLDPAYPGLEIIAPGIDGMVHAWHADGTIVPGWPQSVGLTQASAVAIGDLEGDGTLQVVIGATFGGVLAFQRDGSLVAGWPTSVGGFPGTVVLADLDGDGKLEVIAASSTQVFAWHADATPVAGFPVTPGATMFTSPAVGDLDGDGLPEIVIGTQDGRVFAWKPDGTLVGGWPQAFPGVSDISTAIALGDLDGDGLPEVIAVGHDYPTSAYKVIAWHGDGRVVAGWPRDLTRNVGSSASVGLADVDGDGSLEVVVMSTDNNVQIFHADGTSLAGWPRLTSAAGADFLVSSPSIADLDGDGSMEVVAEGGGPVFDGVSTNKIHAFHHDGTTVAGWPKNVSADSSTSAVIADIDGDGGTDIIVGSDGMFVWSVPGTYDRKGAEWPTFRHDNRRTGAYVPKAGVVLLFDTSGSMSSRPDGTVPAPVTEQRITLAKRAASPFLEELNDFNRGKARFGIATFPALPSTGSCDSKMVTPMTLIGDAAKNRAVMTTIPGLTTDNGTPLLAGMSTAARMLEEQRSAAIVLLSDGYHNCPGFTSIGDAAVTALIARLNESAIRVFSIGFGRPTDPDHPLLEGFASRTTPPGFLGSQFYDVTTPSFDPAAWTPATALQSTYKSILVDALGLQAAIDPLAVIAGGGHASHNVHLNEHDRRVSFFLSWRTANGKRLQLTVKASDGSVVPTLASGVRSHLGDTYAILTVDAPFLRLAGKLGAAPWKLEVGAGGVPAGQSEPYQYSVIVDSALTFEPRLDRTKYFAGEKLLLTARLAEAGKRLTRPANVRVDVTRPSEGLGSWLARQVVTPAELSRIPERRGTEILQPFQRKAIYLEEIRKVRPPGPKFGESIRLYDDGTHGDVKAGDGIYSAEAAITQPGVYSLHFHATGKSAKGLNFDRDRVVQKYVAVNALPQWAKVDVLRLDARRLQIVVKPQDARGTLLGPGHQARLRVASDLGRPDGTLVDALDGTYRQTITLAQGPPIRELKLSLSIDGSAVNLKRPVPAR